jgi:hypothetical protein
MRRTIFHWAETSRMPIFKLGATLCARKSVLLQWIAEQENNGWRRPSPPAKKDPKKDDEPPSGKK